MARSIQDMVSQMEEELESALNEVNRLQSVAGDPESELDNRQSTIDEQDEYIAELETFVEFVRRHFPDAGDAFDVRERLEKASGTEA